MKTKQTLLDDIQAGLNEGLITKADIAALVKQESIETVASGKTTVVDIMFYIAGIVLYSAMLSVISQSWEDGNALTHILLSAGFGVALWAVAYYLIAGSVRSEIRSGLVNALLLTGSLSAITGGFIIASKVVGGFDEVSFVSSAVTLGVLGALYHEIRCLLAARPRMREAGLHPCVLRERPPPTTRPNRLRREVPGKRIANHGADQISGLKAIERIHGLSVTTRANRVVGVDNEEPHATKLAGGLNHDGAVALPAPNANHAGVVMRIAEEPEASVVAVAPEFLQLVVDEAVVVRRTHENGNQIEVVEPIEPLDLIDGASRHGSHHPLLFVLRRRHVHTSGVRLRTNLHTIY